MKVMRYVLVTALLILPFSLPFLLANSVNQPGPVLFIMKIGTQAKPLGNNCFAALIRLNLTYTGDNTYPIATSNFWLIITQRNIVVSNSTNISYLNPTNTISQIILFPNIPIILLLSFNNVCVSSVASANLLYLDSNFQFRFSLP